MLLGGEKIPDFTPEFQMPSDIINLSWTSFNLVQPYYLRQKAEKIKEYLNDFNELLKNLRKQNESIRGKFKIDNKEVFYQEGIELEKYLETQIIQVAQISNFSDIIYNKAKKERKQILDNYYEKTRDNALKIKSDISRIETEISLSKDDEKIVELQNEKYRLKQELEPLSQDIDKLNTLSMRDIN